MISASELRQNVYRLLDEVLESGTPLEIKRKGQLLRIVPDRASGSRLERLKKHPTLLCDADDVVHLDWSNEWSTDDDL